MHFVIINQLEIFSNFPCDFIFYIYFYYLEIFYLIIFMEFIGINIICYITMKIYFNTLIFGFIETFYELAFLGIIFSKC